MKILLRVGLAAVLSLIVPAIGSAAAVPAPQIVDPAGDANGVYRWRTGGLSGQLVDVVLGRDFNPVGPGVETGPASYSPADLRSVRFETLFRAVPVGADGIDYQATGLRMRLATETLPKSDAGTLSYEVKADLVSIYGSPCYATFAGYLNGPLAPPNARRHESMSWFQDEVVLAGGVCPDGQGAIENPAWKLKLDPAAPGMVFDFPFDTFSEGQLDFIGEGALLSRPHATVQASFASIDATVPGRDFLVGSDMPADVACTQSCP